MVRIEDYGLIGNCETAALVSKDGSIDWLCLPHFDSGACFAKLLGTEDNGFWRIAPKGEYSVTRSYAGNTMILETTFSTSTGKVKLTDCLIVEAKSPTLIRLIEGLEGQVDMGFEYVVRFDYGSIVPWVTRTSDGDRLAVGGPDSMLLQTTFAIYGKNLRTFGEFIIQSGEKHHCVLSWSPSHLNLDRINENQIEPLVQSTADWWNHWIQKCTYHGEFDDLVKRSLLVLKSLTFAPTGGIVAAPTTSLPERFGGSRNWDYRFSWVRDSTFTLYSLLTTGYIKEAEDWRRWLVRAVAGTPSQVNIMYGIRGERRLHEVQLSWLQGFEGSTPVRIGNAAYTQRQLDIFGELMDTLQLGRRTGLAKHEVAWSLQKKMIDFVAQSWREPDEGIWEVRGGRKHFVHSKVMAWVALDRGIKAIQHYGLDGDVERWKALRHEIKEEVLKNGFNSKLNSFTQSYGSDEVDASLLQLPVLGFIPAKDPRMVGTVTKIEEDLMDQGFLFRYNNDKVRDGLRGTEGKFLACTFWLVDYFVLAGELQKARELFERLISVRNDVGLLSEEYNTHRKQMIGNFPQALSHIALINSAINLSSSHGSARHRSEESSQY